MRVLDDLVIATRDVSTLGPFIDQNFQGIYDFFKFQKHADLVRDHHAIDSYLQLNRQVLVRLDTSRTINLSFLTLLLDISERLSLRASFKYLFEHLKTVDSYDVGRRLNAAALYLIRVTLAKTYLDRYDQIFTLLEEAMQKEEDSKQLVSASFANFYALVVDDLAQFNSPVVASLQTRVKASLKNDEHSFLNQPFMLEILQIDITEHVIASTKIRQLIDEYLRRDSTVIDYKENFLIEVSTEYSDKLAVRRKITFDTIRDFATSKLAQVSSPSLFSSLGRGVSILQEENQMYQYLYSYGNMHKEKLIEAFKTLPNNFLSENVSVIDWGCGQGIATVLYNDYLSQNNLKGFEQFNSLTLVEPSEICLKRASFHAALVKIKEIRTVHKDFDSLASSDFRHISSGIKLHFFSNVLDMDFFSLSKLTALIDRTFNGRNVFVCVSPYVNDLKTSRVDAFMLHFRDMPGFKVLSCLQNRHASWKNSWTRVYRIFSVG